MNADILILGAGIAGLRCGIELLRKRPSQRVVLLEKYKYIGGRIVTYKKSIEDIRGKCQKVQWENGAGRIHKSHTKVLQLLKDYKLTTIPIDDTIYYEENGILTKNIFMETMSLLSTALEELPLEYLATHTLREALTSILGNETTDALLLQFPYRAEVDTLRADLVLESFR
jgi:monoamine oxidase